MNGIVNLLLASIYSFLSWKETFVIANLKLKFTTSITFYQTFLVQCIGLWCNSIFITMTFQMFQCKREVYFGANHQCLLLI